MNDEGVTPNTSDHAFIVLNLTAYGPLPFLPTSSFIVPRSSFPPSLADDLDEDALRPPAVELAVENLLPRAEVETAIRDGDDDLAAHDLPLVVRVAVVLAGAVVVVLVGAGVERRE